MHALTAAVFVLLRISEAIAKANARCAKRRANSIGFQLASPTMTALSASSSSLTSGFNNNTNSDANLKRSSNLLEVPGQRKLEHHRALKSSLVSPLPIEDDRDIFLQKFGMGRAYTKHSLKPSAANTIDPEAPWLLYWNLTISLTISYNLILLVARATFVQLQQDYVALWLTLDYVADALYIADMLLRSRTCFYDRGSLVVDYATLWRAYIRSWMFIVDLCSVLPTDLFYLVAPQGTSLVVVRFNRLLRVAQLVAFVHHVEARSNYPNGARLAFLLSEVFVITHWNCCLYFWISSLVGLNNDNFVYYPSYVVKDVPESQKTSISDEYGFSLFWSFMMLTSIVHVPEPHTDAEFAFFVAEVLFSVVLFASIVGSVGVAIENIGAEIEEFQKQVASVRSYLVGQRVETRLEKKVMRLLGHARKYSMLEEEEVLQTLPKNLQTEIAINVHYESLKHVSLFQECEPGLLAELMLKLKLEIFGPGDYVCRKGHVGRHMYIVRSGKLQVVSADASQVFATLSSGAVFGEISLLNISGNINGNRRTANVCSIGFSELLSLSCDDLWHVLNDYPEAKQKMIDRGISVLQQSKALDEEFIEREKNTAKQTEMQSEQLVAKVVILDEQLKCLRTTLEQFNQSVQQRLEKARCELKCRRVAMRWRSKASNTKLPLPNKPDSKNPSRQNTL